MSEHHRGHCTVPGSLCGVGLLTPRFAQFVQRVDRQDVEVRIKMFRVRFKSRSTV